MRDIGKLLNRKHSTIQKIINKFRYEGTKQNKMGRGRKRKLKVFIESNKEKFPIVPKLITVLSTRSTICTETVRRVLRRNNLNGRITRKRPYISKANQKKRFKFTQEQYAQYVD